MQITSGSFKCGIFFVIILCQMSCAKEVSNNAKATRSLPTTVAPTTQPISSADSLAEKNDAESGSNQQEADTALNTAGRGNTTPKPIQVNVQTGVTTSAGSPSPNPSATPANTSGSNNSLNTFSEQCAKQVATAGQTLHGRDISDLTYPIFDVDGSSKATALSDGVCIAQYINGGHFDPGCLEKAGTRANPEAATSYIKKLVDRKITDLDGDGLSNNTDATLLVRFLFRNTLALDELNPDDLVVPGHSYANSQRNTPSQLSNYIRAFTSPCREVAGLNATGLPTPIFDIDGNGKVVENTDTLLATVFVMGRELGVLPTQAKYDALIDISSARRKTAADLNFYLNDLFERKILDIDGNGQTNSNTDMLLSQVYATLETSGALPLRAEDVIGRVGSGATRKTASEIAAYLTQLFKK